MGEVKGGFFIMQTSKQTKFLGGVYLFSNIRVLTLSALFAALSVIFKCLSFTAGPFRISFENLPILMGGIFFGPIIGMVVGVIADLVGCLVSGYSVNIFITFAAALMGLISGFISHYTFKKNKTLNLALAVYVTHIISSMIVKSIGFYIYYGYAWQTLIFRIPLYIVIGTAEFYIIYLLLKNKSFSGIIERMCNR